MSAPFTTVLSGVLGDALEKVSGKRPRDAIGLDGSIGAFVFLSLTPPTRKNLFFFNAFLYDVETSLLFYTTPQSYARDLWCAGVYVRRFGIKDEEEKKPLDQTRGEMTVLLVYGTLILLKRREERER